MTNINDEAKTSYRANASIGMHLCTALKYRHLSDKARSKMTLATAAASSAAVPLIFAPVSIDGMYRTRPKYRVVLVDGSISDNTGMRAECLVLVFE